MAVVIRMARQGGKKNPFYRIVASDSRKAQNGQCLEVLGTYNPKAPHEKTTFAHDRLAYWLDQGARPSELVGSLLAQRSRPPSTP